MIRHAMIALLFAGTILCGELLADITTTGVVDAPYDDSDPWVVNIGDEFIVGYEANGSLSVTGGSDVTANMSVYIGDYAAEATGTTGTFLLTGLGSTFSVDPSGESMLFIGPMAEGTLTVADQAILTSHDSILGGSEAEEGDGFVAGEGHATVSGGGQWDAGWMTVGGIGSGFLTIQDNGSAVTTDSGEVGLLPDAVGNVIVEEAGSWTVTADDENGGNLVVGVWGDGTLEIRTGGQVQSDRGWIGGVDPVLMGYDDDEEFDVLGNPNGTGEVLVTGENSQWNSGDSLVVGAWGTGTLDIENEGTVTASLVSIGGMPIVLGEGEEYSRDLLPDGTGTVTVTGDGSLLAVPDVTGDEMFFVGYSGTGTLNVEAGGDVTAPSLVLGGAPDSTGTVVVTGSGSTLSAEYEINVGAWGTGQLTVSAGGGVSAGELLIGGFDASDVDDLPQAALDDFGAGVGTGTVTVTGGTSTLDAAERIYVGNYGDGTLNVELGGTVTAGEIAVGVAAGSQGTVNISGAGSTLEADESRVSMEPEFVPGVMIVGGYGTGDVTVSNQGELIVEDTLYVGGYPAGELDFEPEVPGTPDGTGTVTITGAGSTLTGDGLAIGYSGQGTLNILNDATVTSGSAIIGVLADGVGEVLVDNTANTWTSTGSIVVGAYGEGTLTVQNGGHVEATDVVYIGGYEPEELEDETFGYAYNPNGTGTLTVTGAESLLEASGIAVGVDGDGTLEILAGAEVQAQGAVVGLGADGIGNVLVDGTGSTWRIESEDVENEVPAALGEGEVIVSNGGQVLVDGEGILNVADRIVVGSEGTGSMSVSDGGTVTAETLDIGGLDPQFDTLGEYFADGVEFTEGTGDVTVTGAGSSLQVEDLAVGIVGVGTLDILNGASVTSDGAMIGGLPGATGEVQVDGGSTWNGGDAIAVGLWGQGDLTISGASEVTTGEMYIGGAAFEMVANEEDAYDADLVPDGTGTVLVTDNGSLLNVTGEETLYVGYANTGELNVEGGGDVTAGSLVVGAAPDVTGTVIVTGAGSTLTAEDATIGAWGTGNMTIAAGGQVTAEYMTIGGFDASDVDDLPQEVLDEFGDGLGTGVVTVMGDGSSLSVTGDYPLLVGNWGTGTLTASEGGLVESDSLMIGAAPDATGTVTINDAELTIAGSTAVGAWGQGNLTVSGGSEASVGTLYIGGFDETEAPLELAEAFGASLGTGTVAVTGAGSVLDVTEDNTVYVGYSGQGTLEILNGGRVNSHSGVVGVEAGGDGLVTVDGTGSIWQITGGETDLEPSAAGEGEVIVSNGGQIVVTGGTGGLDVAGDVTVGSEGDGSTMSVLNGANVYSDGLIIGGYDPDLDPLDEYFDAELDNGSGTVTVDGDGSIWDAEHVLVGFSGDGTLNITDGGEVMDDFAAVGVMPDVTGYVNMDSDSRWVTDVLAVGIWGSGTVDIYGGSRVYADDVFIGGLPLDLLDAQYSPDLTADGTGVVNVSGEGSRLYAAALSSLYVGYSSDGTLNVEDGGYVESNTAVIGFRPGSTGQVTVDGISEGEIASSWDNTTSIAVGGYGDGSLTVSNGGEVYVDETVFIGGFDPDEFLGLIDEADGLPDGTGEVTVTGDGSLLSTYVVAVGAVGNGTMDVLAGGQVNSGVGLIGFGPDSISEVTVDGAGSAWTLSDLGESEEDWSLLGVGIYGEGTLTISNGGQVSVADAVIGGFDLEDIGAEAYAELWGDPNGAGTLTVTGEDSLLDVEWDLCVGRSGVGNLFVTSGAQVNTGDDGYIGDEPNSVGAVIVNGASSEWDIGDNLYVGGYGTGTLTISDGADVALVEDAYIGYGESGNGTVVVTGDDSALHVGYDLYVGGHDEGAAGLGSLYVNDGGWVNVWSEMYVWETGLVGGDGTITVMTPTTLHNYGTIAPGDDGIGTLTVEGSVVFHEGSTYAVEINNDDESDKLVVDGDVTIEGGTVQVSSEGTILGEHEYEIISADSVTGEFDDLDTALLDFSFETIGLDYDEVSVWLSIAAANFNDPNVARTYNQRQVAGTLQEIADPENPITGAVQQLGTADEVRGAYDQLSGQTRPALAPMTVAGSSKFLGTVTSRVQTVKSGLVAGAFDSKLLAAAGPDQALGGSTVRGGQDFAVGNGSDVLADKRWGLWGRGYGLVGDRDDSDVPGYGYHIYGGSFGVDYQINETLLAGLVGGLSEGDVNFDDSQDTTDFGAAHIGLYGSLAWDVWNVDAVATYANLDYETRRFVDVLDERLSGNFDGSEFAAYVEVSRDYDLAPSLTLSPLASVQYTYVDLDGYTETGGTSALSFDEQTHESIRGSLGARLTKRVIETAGDFQADVQLRGRWVHEFGDEQASVDSSFASDPTVVFTVKDGEISRDSAVLGVGFLTEFSDRTRAYFDYDTRLNSDETVHVFSASLQYRW